jgi:large subunit ribosomal protein L6
MRFSKKYSVKIPKEIKILYYKEQNFIILIGPLGRKILKTQLKLFFTKNKNIIYVTKVPMENLKDNRKKTIVSMCGTIVAYLKQMILEISVKLTKKIKLIGVGYRVFPIELMQSHILMFRLGYSHSIYYKIPQNIQILPIKSVYIYFFGSSYYSVTQAAANIRLYKSPEPYKGKGILYDNEKIILKEGKKV